MTTSNARCEPLELMRDLPTTPQDVAAQRRLATLRPVSSDQYLLFLASFEAPSPNELRRKRGPSGAPFDLFPPT